LVPGQHETHDAEPIVQVHAELPLKVHEQVVPTQLACQTLPEPSWHDD
jgi:hypothetical protein